MKNNQLEFNAIAYVMQTRDPSLLISILPEHFGNTDLAKLFILIRKYYTDTSEFCGWDVLAGMVAKACKTPEMSKFMIALLEQVRERDITGLTADALLNDLREYSKFRTVLKKVDPLIKSVEEKDIDKCLGTLKELHDSVFASSALSSLEEADMASMASRKIKFDFRSTGIKPIDDRGGLIVGGLTIVAAPAKTGKSTLAGMIGLHQYLNEEGSIAYFSYEMNAAEVRARIFANYAEIDLGDLMAEELTKEDQLKLLLAESIFYCGDLPEVHEYFNSCKTMSREEYFKGLLATVPHRKNKLYIFDGREDWDELFVKMNLLATTKGVKTFIVDYPFLVPRGKAHSNLASWEYSLLMNKNLKTFSHTHGLNVITPAQLDPGKKGDDPRLRFVSNAINDCDLALFLVEHDEDKTLQTVTVIFKAMRNFKTVKGGAPFPEPFKILKELHQSRFAYLEF